MNRRCRACCQPVTRTQVTCGALAGYRHVGMECTRIPAGIPRTVAGVAVGNRYAGQRLVRDVIRRRAIRRCETTGMAGGALFRHHHLGVVPAAGLPRLGAVAADAVGCGRNMRPGLAGCRGAVVAAGTVGR
jgi:hypothetical protein